MTKREKMTVTSAPRETWAGREVQTDKFPVVGVPADVSVGEAIVAEYCTTASYGLWMYRGKEAI